MAKSKKYNSDDLVLMIVNKNILIDKEYLIWEYEISKELYESIKDYKKVNQCVTFKI